MILGAQCTTWLAGGSRWCGQPATFLRFGADGETVESVVCAAHRRRGDLPILAGTPRAPASTFWLGRVAYRKG